MKNRHEVLEDQLEDYSAQLKSLNYYIKELTDMAAKVGTDRWEVKGDLEKAEHNVQYYQAEIGRLKKELGESDTAKPGNIAKPGVLSLVLSPISFLVGALLGSRLKTRRANKDI